PRPSRTTCPTCRNSPNSCAYAACRARAYVTGQAYFGGVRWPGPSLGLRRSAAGGEVVRAPGRDSRPLGDGASARPLRHRRPVGRAAVGPGDGALLWPAGRRVLPRLLTAVDGQVHQRVAVVHRLGAAALGPVGLEDPVAVAQVADQVEQADLTPAEKRFEGWLRRVPRHVPVHELTVAAALVVGALAEDREGDVPRMQVGQLGDLGGDPGAALALLGGGMAVPPHEVVGDQLPAALERLEQRDRTV